MLVQRTIHNTILNILDISAHPDSLKWRPSSSFNDIEAYLDSKLHKLLARIFLCVPIVIFLSLKNNIIHVCFSVDLEACELYRINIQERKIGQYFVRRRLTQKVSIIIFLVKCVSSISTSPFYWKLFNIAVNGWLWIGRIRDNISFTLA